MNLINRLVQRVNSVFAPPEVRERLIVKSVDRPNRERLKPGFIIGVYRSGTTLLRYVLDSHKNIAVPPESTFLLGIAELWRNDWYRKGLQGVGVDEDSLRIRLREFVSSVLDDYATAKGKARWFDKTPSYIDTLDFIDYLFGEECRYVMLYRHGLDVANSMVNMHGNDVNRGPARYFADRYPDSPRLTNACYWAEKCETMLTFEAQHPKQCFRIHYEHYSNEPERYLKGLFEFLDEDWDPEVLHFSDKQHDFGLQDNKILKTKSFAPNTGTYLAWPDDEITRAEEAVRPTLEKLGYSV